MARQAQHQLSVYYMGGRLYTAQAGCYFDVPAPCYMLCYTQYARS